MAVDVSFLNVWKKRKADEIIYMPIKYHNKTQYWV